MTNPNNSIGTNAAFSGRTSVNAFNDGLAIYEGRGVVSGFGIEPSTGMTVAIGGNGSTRDVAVAEDNIGNRTTINNISQQPVSLTIPAAPASNSRIDLIVAYVDNPPDGTSDATDNPADCGLITVSGSIAAAPTAPTDTDIRAAITLDGASGTTAYYVVLGQVNLPTGTTDITVDMLTQGSAVKIRGLSLDVIYPVGSIYMSVNSTDPSLLFGGTWAKIENRFLLAAGNTWKAGSIGGASTINLAHSHTVNSHTHALTGNTGSHTLTLAEIPSHTHTTQAYVPWARGGTATTATSPDGYRWHSNNASASARGGGGGHTHPLTGNTKAATPGTSSALGNNQSIMPPYLAVNVWQRTA